MATARARALSLGFLLVLALCLTARAGERQPTDGYISYTGLPRAGGGTNAGVPGGSAGNGGHSAGDSDILGRCKSCRGQPPTMAVSKTAAGESKGAYISHAALSADKYPSPPTMTGAKKADKYPAPTFTDAETVAVGRVERAYRGPAALSEEKARYISYAALKHNQPSGKKCRRASSSCP